jgi:hypothetical protein
MSTLLPRFDRVEARSSIVEVLPPLPITVTIYGEEV